MTCANNTEILDSMAYVIDIIFNSVLFFTKTDKENVWTIVFIFNILKELLILL